MIGRTVGKYRVVERIGRGGMGTVYRAVDDTLHRDVAIKVLNAELHEPEVARRFRTEAITVARLNHPGIATVFELFEHDDQWLMVMEFVRGETLEAIVDRTGPLPPERAAEVCLHALAALAHAHSLGVVHRDLKPANLMIADTGVVKVMDFGIARVAGTEHITSAGYMMGTPAYMAPEQVLGRDVDARADLYAMGVVFYRLVTGKLPFTGGTPFAVAQSQVNDAPTPIGVLRTDLPPWVDRLVARALAKDPADRFQSAAAFHAALSRCLSDRGPSWDGDPSGTTELMVTPPYAMPTGTVRPRVDTGPTLVARVNPSAAVPGEGAASPAGRDDRMSGNRGGLMIAAVLLLLTIVAGAIWWGRSPATPTTGSSASAPPPASDAQTPPASSASASPAVPAAVPAPPPVTASAPVSSATAPGARASNTPASRPAAVDPLLFSNVKLLTVTGRKAKDQDVLLSLGADRVAVTKKDGGAPLQSLLYARVVRAMYSRGKVPRFAPALPAPPADLDMPGLFSSTHHWLALQSKDSYLILRMEDANYTAILDALQARAHVKVARP